MIRYIEGIKYQLYGDYTIKTNIIGYTVDTRFLKLTPVGVLTIKAGYAWDGPSGPTFDSHESMRGSLVHDAFYELIRRELVSRTERGAVDDLFYDILVEDGMSKTRAKAWLVGVKAFAGFAADPKNRRKIKLAP